ncbi:MAG: RNA methyltransferase [Candidatus Methanomethylophilaceae archaeon]|nr:RNA methyltransferase [Candidatus Methanomethylophilaceae archaeon]MDY0223834.1 RNA methyltransferase [Candidatus Methanomethylophilaceae archaeon]
MPEIRVILVGPKFEGNIGAVCRSMANFDVRELYLVNPCEIGDDAYRRAKHGSDILDNAVTVTCIDDALTDCFLVVGTSGIVTKGDKNYARVPVPAREFAQNIRGYEQRIALLLGREDIGLLQEELNKCDILINVPTSEQYPILNLSHAATLVLYEIFQAHSVDRRAEPADHREKELMFEFFMDLLDAVDYSEPRKEGTAVMFRRMMGRSIPTKYEYNTIMGIFGDAAKIINNGKNYR